MTTKTALQQYFDRLQAAWREKHGSPLYTYWDERVDPMIYSGKFTDDGETFAYWQPVEKELQFDFPVIEQATSVKLHSSVREYFNSYWFFAIEATCQGRNLTLYSVLPGLEPQQYERVLREYRTWWEDRETEFAPIGQTAGNEVVVVHHASGEVRLLTSTESPATESFAPSLPGLILQLEPFLWGP